MKKLFFPAIVLTLALVLSGCFASTPTPTPDVAPLPPQGITVNTIEFEPLAKIPYTLKDTTKRGFRVFEETDGYIVVVQLGEKPNAGYSVKVSHVEDNEGKTVVIVDEITPPEGSMSAQVITYPTTAIKMKKNIVPNFFVESSEEKFQKIGK